MTDMWSLCLVTMLDSLQTYLKIWNVDASGFHVHLVCSNLSLLMLSSLI
jgi:hypothetical protein